MRSYVAAVAWLLLCFPGACMAESIVFPPDTGVVDVTRPPYGAKGDGQHDDTDGIQRALNDYTGRRNILYFPNGTYLITRTLSLPLKNPQGQTNWGNTNLQGQSRAGVVLRLKDSTFPDAVRPAPVITFGRHASADWFACSVRNLTIDTGKGNPGAIGLQFFSNNTGCVREVTIRSGDGEGAIGLDLAYNDMNGPHLIKDVLVRGFDVGIATGHTVNSQTFCEIALQRQRKVGFSNGGQCVSIEGLWSVNSVPAVSNAGGLMALMGARLTGARGASSLAAIENQAGLYARDVLTSGYQQAIRNDAGSKSGAAGPDVAEFASREPIRLFPGDHPLMHLPVREAPDVPWDDPKGWACALPGGAQRKDDADITDGLQKAIDSGATTVYIPCGSWRISHTVHVRGKVRRIIGCEGNLDVAPPLSTTAAPVFQVDGGPIVVIERLTTGFMNGPFWFLQNDSAGSLELRDMTINFQGPEAYRNRPGAGSLFIEDVVGGPFHFTKERVWARQLNQESQGDHVVNFQGNLWILGLKTERGGTLVRTESGGVTEVIGGLCYTTTAGGLAPMFANDNAAVTVTLGERCYNGDPYRIILRESHGGITREMTNTDPRYGGTIVLYNGRL